MLATVGPLGFKRAETPAILAQPLTLPPERQAPGDGSNATITRTSRHIDSLEKRQLTR